MCFSAGTMMALSLAASAVQTVISISQANAQEDAAYEAALRNFEVADAENTRLQNEAIEIAEENKSDRMRQANAELGSIRVIEGLSDASRQALVINAAYNEGLDLSRIDKNLDRQNEALQSNKRAAKVGYLNATTLASNQASSSRTSAVMGFVGSGLSLGVDYKKHQDRIKATM